MLTADQIQVLGDKAESLLSPVVEFLMGDIAQRVAEAGQLTATAAYLTWVTQTLGKSQKEVKKEVARLLKKAQDEVEKLMKQAAKTGYLFDLNRLPTHRGIPFEANSSLQQIVDGYVAMAQEDLKNITQTMGFVTPYGEAKGLTEAYRDTCDFAFKKVTTGAQDFTGAVRDAMKNLADKGIVRIDYESGVHTSAEAAARRSVMGGMGLMQEHISQKNHDDLKCDGWEISAHWGSAPDHEPIQGKQYTDAEYKALNGRLKRRIGTLNCGHSAFPVILGIQKPMYTEEELEKFRMENEAGFTLKDGKHYTLYEATQQQRAMERGIRKRQRQILLDKKSGDEEKLTCDQVRLIRQKEAYVAFCEETKLREKYERTEVEEFTREDWKAARKAAKEAQKTVAKQKNSSIMESEELFSLKDTPRENFRFVSDERFEALTVEARKKGATIIRGTPEIEKHLDMQGASASTLGDILMFRKQVCLSEIIEETHHFAQNLAKLNDDKGEPLRTILNEIDAKEHVIRSAKKYRIPRNEVEHIQKQLDGYKEQLEQYRKGKK